MHRDGRGGTVINVEAGIEHLEGKQRRVPGRGEGRGRGQLRGLAHLGWPKEETRIESICARAIETGNCTPDVGGKLGTNAVATFILGELRKG